MLLVVGRVEENEESKKEKGSLAGADWAGCVDFEGWLLCEGAPNSAKRSADIVNLPFVFWNLINW